MRLGQLTKGAVSGPAITAATAAAYLNVVAGAAGVAEAVSGAVAWCEKYTGAALDRVTYELRVLGAEAGQFVLLPAWYNMALAGTSATDGTSLDELLPVATLDGLDADGNVTLTVSAGYGPVALPDDVAQSILYVAALLWHGEAVGSLPPLVQAPLDNVKCVWVNYGRPKQLTSWDPATGAYRERW